MAEVDIEIGGRSFTVACQDGEQPYLKAAASLLDGEAQVIIGQIGRMPAEKMLLMAGLMLADKTASLEEDLQAAQAHIEAQEKTIRSAEERLADRARRIAELQDAAPPERVAVVPDRVVDTLSELAARAEALADALERKDDAG